MGKDAGGQYNAIVTQRIEIAPGLLILRVTPDTWELGDFVPGQYSVLGLLGAAPRCERADPEEPPPPPEKLIKRAYSIASSSRVREYLEFYITLVHSGALTPRLYLLDIGDRLWMGRKITGMFTLDDVPAEANVLLFATGTGIAPYMSMVRTVLNRGGPRRLGIVHAARHSWDLGYREELQTLEQVSPQLSYLPLISEPEKEPVPWRGRTGFCHDLWLDGTIEKQWGFRPIPENTHIFLCGNPLMIQEMLKVLAEEGFREHSRRSPGNVHLEKYW